MVRKFLATGVAVAVFATSATAYVPPGGLSGAPGLPVTNVAEPLQKGNARVVQQQQRRPVIVQRPLVRNNPVTVRQSARPLVRTVPQGVRVTSPVVRARPSAGRIPAQFVHVRSFRRHNYYGRVVGGVVLGSILAASAYYAYASRPASNLCWYWTNSDEERGYWDYCEPPDDD